MTDYVDWENLELLFNLERDNKIYEQEQQDYIHVELEELLSIFPGEPCK